MTRLHFGVNFGIERSIGWVWSIRANAGCHEHRRSKFALMNIQIRFFLLTERDIVIQEAYIFLNSRQNSNRNGGLQKHAKRFQAYIYIRRTEKQKLNNLYIIRITKICKLRIL